MRVLFVEDDPMNRRVVKDMLTIVDAEMAEAEDAETGLAMIDAHDYDIILMDLRMPGMDGLTAIGHIRARTDAKAKLPIIVVTADTAADLREKCLAGGANDVLGKPVAMNALFDAIGDLVDPVDDMVI
jgi:CheY-like chemotaxis protein